MNISLASTKDAIISFISCLQWAAENELPLHEVNLLRKIRQMAVYISMKN